MIQLVYYDLFSGFSPDYGMTTRRRRTRSGEYTEQGIIAEKENLDINIDSMSSCRDRTAEFASAVRSLQSRQGAHVRTSPLNQRKVNGIVRSQFSQIAKQIGHDISNTFTKLEKLTLLAKKKSLFDDRPVEIQELTYIIKQDIKNLNQQLAQLQELVRVNRSQSKNVQTHSQSVVVALQTKLAKMSQSFKSVLEVRTENLKHQKQRREQFSQGPSPETLAVASMKNGSVLQRADHIPNGIGDKTVAIDMDQFQNSQYQDQMLEEQDTYIKSRATAMESIESTIVELGGIFQQLANMVKIQEEQIERIDANVEETEANVEGAHGELLKYFQSVTSNRWLIIKIFFVLIVFFIVFVVFMV
ncbi:syntaxin-5-like [Dendronephthya gigantea]|uniref:syntaxin-5-like n=1 Tax=Dendronephthya gigantea TaxID=151771 RepID=UPI00106B8616|nr:syntaxin-5-like [Dendronephthya gigantea]